MGILSDPKSRQKIINAISHYNNLLCAVCYVVGIVWFIALAYPPMNAKTYFSENALLPGVVESNFEFEDNVNSLLNETNEELKKDKRTAPRMWVYNKFREIGLETYIQNYSVKYPLHIIRGQLVPGQNVYAILRTRRAASTETVVLSTPIRAKVSDLSQTQGGIVLMLGLAKYFMRQPYWSKDIIFLVTDHEQIGMQAWLDGYHHVDAEYIRPGEFAGRSGPIQAALNLEIPSVDFKYFNVKIEGLNGQLPNLDLVNLVVRLCEKDYLDVRLHDSKAVSEYKSESLAGFQHAAQTMLKMMWAQATGLPSGNHGLFHRYHIEAVTLEGVRKKGGKISLPATGRVVEGIFRSLNNLLEKFHQSFFFYILTSTGRYVSIGLYMIPFGILCASCAVKAVALWVSRNQKEGAKEDDQKHEAENEHGDGDSVVEEKNKTEKTVVDKVDEMGDKNTVTLKSIERMSLKQLKDIVNEEPEMETEEEKPFGVVSILPAIISSYIISILCYSGPDVLASMAVPFKMNIEGGIFFGLLALFAASLAFPKLVFRHTEEKHLLFDWELLKAVCLIFQTLVLFSLSLTNISLAFFIAACYVPVSIIIHPTKNWVFRWTQKFLLLLISPLSMLYLAAVISSLDGEYKTIWQLLYNAWNTLSRGLLLSIVDKYLFGSWLFSLFCFAILPNWLTLWGISFCEVI